MEKKSYNSIKQEVKEDIHKQLRMKRATKIGIIGGIIVWICGCIMGFIAWRPEIVLDQSTMKWWSITFLLIVPLIPALFLGVPIFAILLFFYRPKIVFTQQELHRHMKEYVENIIKRMTYSNKMLRDKITTYTQTIQKNDSAIAYYEQMVKEDLHD